jgi:hypothetical protein
MIQEVPIELLTLSIGATTAFAGLLWRDLNNKVKDLQQHDLTCPVVRVQRDITEIKNDLKWIKNIIGKDV